MLQNLYYLRKEENCSDVVMSVFYSPVLTHSLTFLQLWTGVSWRWVYFPPIS